GLAGVKIDGKWGSIDKTGKIRIEPKYEYLYSFENGVAMVDQHHKIINKEDKTIFESESGVFRIYRLDEGMLYIVTNEGNTIIIDKYGNEISKKPST
ncbi:WG repeat-containing protein, partial [Tepidibacter formicigenes]